MGNNASRPHKRADQQILEKMANMTKGLYAPPCPPTRSKANTKQPPKSNPKQEKRGQKAANASQTGINTNQIKNTQQPRKTSKRKKNKPTSAEPRKGRKENFRLYVPIDDALCGVYDAAEHEDQHDGKSFVSIDIERGGGAYANSAVGGGKSSYEMIDERLSGLYDAFEHEVPSSGRFNRKSCLPIDDTFVGLYDDVGYEYPHGSLHDGKAYLAIDETLSALCNVVDDEVHHNFPAQQPQQIANEAI